MASLSDHLRGTLITVLGVAILSPDALLLRLITADRWTVMFWRGSFLAIGIAVLLLAAHGRGAAAQLRAVRGPGILAGAMLALSTVFFVTSIALTTAANTLVIIAATPLLAAVFSTLILHEPVPQRTWIAIAIGVGAMAVIFSGSLGGGALIGDLCALATACCMACNLIIVRRSRAVSLVPAVGLSGLFLALAVLPLATPLTLGAQDLGLLALLGLVVLPLSFALIALGPRYLPAPEVSLIMLLEAVLGPLWVWLALRETPSLATFVGGALLIGTLSIHALIGAQRAQAVATAALRD